MYLSIYLKYHKLNDPIIKMNIIVYLQYMPALDEKKIVEDEDNHYFLKQLTLEYFMFFCCLYKINFAF